jgi:hypothetical protein
MKTRLLLAMTLTMALLAGSSAIDKRATTFAQNGKNTNWAASISFTAYSTGIHDGDGRGTYMDGVDGTFCELFSTAGGDLSFEQDANRTKTPRTGYVDYTNPVAPAVSLGIQYPTGITNRYPNFTAHAYDLLQMAIGSTKMGPVIMATGFNGTSYYVKFGETAGDGSNQVLYMRISANQWEVQTLPSQDVGRLVSGLPGTTQTFVGLYHVPLDFIITQL